MTNIEKLKQFIIDNKLSFNEGERNTNVTILCGFALFNNNTTKDCKESIPKEFIEEAHQIEELFQEIERVYKYAEKYNYGKYWETEGARTQYIF